MLLLSDRMGLLTELFTESRTPRTSRRWLGAGLAACMIGWGTNQFTPLLLLYRARSGLSAAVVEAMFAMYAIGLVPGLLAGGALSDRIGRRPVVLFALVTSMIGGVVLIAGAGGTGWLFAGRLIVGLGSGGAFSAGSAWIKELSAPPYDDEATGAGATRASGAMTLGFALGPLVAGTLAQWAPSPTVLPYLPQLAGSAVALVLTARTPETVPPRAVAETRGPLRSQLRIRGLGQSRFVRVVLPVAPWVFTAVSVGFVYVPGLVAGHAFGIPIAFAAALAVAAAGGGVAVQPLARRLAGYDGSGRSWLLVTGLALVTAGLVAEAGVTTADALGPLQPVLALLASAELGCGYGITLVFGLTEVAQLAPPEDLAGLTGAFQVACYSGFAIPDVLSLLQAAVPPPLLLLGLAALAALTLATTTWQLRRTDVDVAKGGRSSAEPSRTRRASSLEIAGGLDPVARTGGRNGTRE
jgi:MFS family permease